MWSSLVCVSALMALGHSRTLNFTGDPDCSSKIAGLQPCFESFNPNNTETARTFCEGSCLVMIREVYTDCPDENISVSMLEQICEALTAGSGATNCSNGLQIIQNECFNNMTTPMSSEEVIVFCASECLQKIRDHFSTCPDEFGILDSFNQSCGQGNDKCLTRLPGLQQCFEFNMTSETSIEEIRAFCESDCPARAQEYYTMCSGPQNDSNIHSIIEGCGGINEECLTRLPGLQQCFEFNMTSETSIEEIRAFCGGDCPARAQEYFTMCSGPQNDSDIHSIIEVCEALTAGSGATNCFNGLQILQNECVNNMTTPMSSEELSTFCASGCLQKIRDHVSTCPDEFGILDLFNQSCGECSTRLLGLQQCFEFNMTSETSIEEIRSFCESDCPARAQEYFTMCSGPQNNSNMHSIIEVCEALTAGSGATNCFNGLQIIQNECLDNITSPMSSEELISFCASDCLQKIHDHFSTCPDEFGILDSFNQSCGLVNEECLMRLPGLQQCFEFNMTSETSIEEIRAFCESDCPARAQEYFSICIGPQNDSSIRSIIEGCAKFGFEITTVGDAVTTVATTGRGTTTTASTVATTVGDTATAVASTGEGTTTTATTATIVASTVGDTATTVASTGGGATTTATTVPSTGGGATTTATTVPSTGGGATTTATTVASTIGDTATTVASTVGNTTTTVASTGGGTTTDTTTTTTVTTTIATGGGTTTTVRDTATTVGDSATGTTTTIATGNAVTTGGGVATTVGDTVTTVRGTATTDVGDTASTVATTVRDTATATTVGDTATTVATTRDAATTIATTVATNAPTTVATTVGDTTTTVGDAATTVGSSIGDTTTATTVRDTATTVRDAVTTATTGVHVTTTVRDTATIGTTNGGNTVYSVPLVVTMLMVIIATLAR